MTKALTRRQAIERQREMYRENGRTLAYMIDLSDCQTVAQGLRKMTIIYGGLNKYAAETATAALRERLGRQP